MPREQDGGKLCLFLSREEYDLTLASYKAPRMNRARKKTWCAHIGDGTFVLSVAVGIVEHGGPDWNRLEV